MKIHLSDDLKSKLFGIVKCFSIFIIAFLIGQIYFYLDSNDNKFSLDFSLWNIFISLFNGFIYLYIIKAILLIVIIIFQYFKTNIKIEI